MRTGQRAREAVREGGRDRERVTDRGQERKRAWEGGEGRDEGIQAERCARRQRGERERDGSRFIDRGCTCAQMQ